LDNLTHTLFGATLARTPLRRAGRGTLPALLISSNAPDIDIVATAGGPLKYLEWHRGPTHGLLGVVGLGIGTAAIVALTYRLRTDTETRTGEPAASFAVLVAVSIIGVLLHILMDVPTVYGTRLLSPFDWHWYAADWMPIVDIYLLMVLAAAMFGRTTPAQRQRKAAVVLALMAANYGMRAAAHHQALELAPRLFGPTLPEWCDTPMPQRVIDSWPRRVPPSPPAPGRRCLVELAAMPSFTSPFKWRIIAQMSNAYELHDIDLLDKAFTETEYVSDAPWRLTLRYPNVWTPAASRAAATRIGQKFLAFSRFPAARIASDAQGAATVRLTDMRFVGGVLALDQPAPRTGLFTATVRIAPDGRIVEERLGAR
jgi:inner membrane protein